MLFPGKMAKIGCQNCHPRRHKPLRLLPLGAPIVPQASHEHPDSVVDGSCSKSFWDSPPRRRLWKAGSSQNGDFLPRFGIYPFLAAFQGTSIPKRFGTTLFRPFREVCVALFDPVSPPPVFLMCHIRMRIGLLRTFSSRSITSGSDEARLAGLAICAATEEKPKTHPKYIRNSP